MPQQPAQFGSNGMLDDWEENFAAITANRTKDDEPVIVHLGDYLWKERSEITAAHICYLIAEANFESYSDSARLCLIGADHWKFPRSYASPEAIQPVWLSTTYEFGGKKSLVLSTTTWIGGKNDFLGIAYMGLIIYCWSYSPDRKIYTLKYMEMWDGVTKWGEKTMPYWSQEEVHHICQELVCQLILRPKNEQWMQVLQDANLSQNLVVGYQF